MFIRWRYLLLLSKTWVPIATTTVHHVGNPPFVGAFFFCFLSLLYPVTACSISSISSSLSTILLVPPILVRLGSVFNKDKRSYFYKVKVKVTTRPGCRICRSCALHLYCFWGVCKGRRRNGHVYRWTGNRPPPSYKQGLLHPTKKTTHPSR